VGPRHREAAREHAVRCLSAFGPDAVTNVGTLPSIGAGPKRGQRNITSARLIIQRDSLIRVTDRSGFPCPAAGTARFPDHAQPMTSAPSASGKTTSSTTKTPTLLGPNRVRLSVARENYARYGAHEERWCGNDYHVSTKDHPSPGPSGETRTNSDLEPWTPRLSAPRRRSIIASPMIKHRKSVFTDRFAAARIVDEAS
jgi:hypothetical protein